MSPSAMIVIAVVALGLGAGSAVASPCGDQIAQLAATARQAEQNPAAGPTAPQSIGAQLGHQPTEESVRSAETQANSSFAAILDRAKALDAEGKTAECMQALATAKLRLELK